MSIYFLTIRFDQQVHAQALGFTDHVYQHVLAADAVGAVRLAKEHFETKYAPLKVVKAEARPALEQDPKRYVFLLS
jgi:hypothetical protein